VTRATGKPLPQMEDRMAQYIPGAKDADQHHA
jgi:hypothetical protein